MLPRVAQLLGFCRLDPSLLAHGGEVAVPSLSVAENVVIRPTGNVEPGAGGQEIEAGLRHVGPALALQPLDHDLVKAMQVTDIGSRIITLRLVDFRSAPIGALLRL